MSVVYRYLSYVLLFLLTHCLLYGNPVGMNQDYGNIGTQVVSMSWGPGNTGKPIIFIQFSSWKHWENNHFDSVSNLEIREHHTLCFSLEPGNIEALFAVYEADLRCFFFFCFFFQK